MPGEVTNLQMTSSTATTIHITWAVSGYVNYFEVIYNFTVKRCSAPPGEQHTGNIFNGSARSYNLTGLNEDSNYSITVRAINNEGSTNATVSANTLTSGKFVWKQ